MTAEIPQFVSNAHATLFSIGEYPIYKFFGRYKGDWGIDLNEVAAANGLKNGTAMFYKFPTYFKVNGSLVKALAQAGDKNAEEHTRAYAVKDETNTRSRFNNNNQRLNSNAPNNNNNRPPTQRRGKKNKSPLRIVSTINASDIQNGAQMGIRALPRDPYEDDEDDGYTYPNRPTNRIESPYAPSAVSSSRPTSAFENSSNHYQGGEYNKQTRNNWDGNVANGQNENNWNNDFVDEPPQRQTPERHQPERHKPEQQQEDDSFSMRFDSNEPNRESTEPTFQPSMFEAIVNGDTLLFKCSLDETTMSISKKLTELFKAVLEYGTENTLPCAKIKSFVEEFNFSGKINMQQFAKLITMFTCWEAKKTSVRMVFSEKLKDFERPTMYEYFSLLRAIPQDQIGECIKHCSIIYVDDANILYIRPEEYNSKYNQLKSDLRMYYDYFQSQNDSGVPNETFGLPIKDVFIGDCVLLEDKENSRFIRCIVSDVLDSGNPIVYAIDEGLTRECFVSDLYPIPRKFRAYHPLCLIFNMRYSDLKELNEDHKRGASLKAQQMMSHKKQGRFKLLKCSDRTFLPSLYYGPWSES